MTETIVSSIACNDCGGDIPDREMNGGRVPCPKCGSLRRNIHETVIRYMTMRGRKNGDNDKR